MRCPSASDALAQALRGSSFRDAREACRPGIQTLCITSGFRIRAKRAPRNDGHEVAAYRKLTSLNSGAR
jgi:hypothetical protein